MSHANGASDFCIFAGRTVSVGPRAVGWTVLHWGNRPVALIDQERITVAIAGRSATKLRHRKRFKFQHAGKSLSLSIRAAKNNYFDRLVWYYEQL